MESEKTTFVLTLPPDLAGQLQTDAEETGLTVEEFLKALHRMWRAYKAEVDRMKGAE